ncbi:MAG TPA: adenosylcobinamide-phosphate synthase CbiB [Dyella sp.]|uniref:adenosylcobinamide-phosphate synthase CbiB n=1 Tax=Dyella sp. TaxID=1869338 RepID=UPI002D7A3D7E|nr:adenosylcobinamide-phosphate synthase CbiB [Dyella sp.]HET6554617.1 adenosylcobinamide-phosphate synthase CbiB [Dyella sp.]
MNTAFAMIAAVLLDAWLGEPRRGHPLVLFGRLAGRIESMVYGDQRARGVIAWCVAVLPWGAATLLLAWVTPWLRFVLDTTVLYLALGLRSLGEHALPVARALEAGDLPAARSAVGRMVSRDTGLLDARQVAAAASESVLENGNDAVFGALFWFAVLGAPGAVLYRLANTLDAMWGYRNVRYERFGWAAARLDDILNYVPARLTALSYVLLGDARRAWRCWRMQAPAWDSPNAGPVMAAGAGALGVCLGGAAPYDGIWEPRPVLGSGAPPDGTTLVRALALVRRSVVLWLAVVALLGWVCAGGVHA